MKLSPKPGAALAVSLLSALALSLPPVDPSQGCVAAHSPQPIISGLDPTSQFSARKYSNGEWIHGLTLTVGYRVYNSYKHYIGTVYQIQRQENHNAVVNHVNLFEVDVNYRLSPRNSFIAYVPFLDASRHGQSSPLNVYRSWGIGDMTLGGETWVWRPPTESHGNINFSYQLKLPTGINDAKGTKTFQRQHENRAPDESIQPGDGSRGFALAGRIAVDLEDVDTHRLVALARRIRRRAHLPSAHGEGISATDHYLWRGGFSRPVTEVRALRGMAFSIGGRMEGVPVRDAFGSSNGFRRPGYVISIEPGMTYSRGRYMVNVSGPWAIERNRKTSVTDYANHTHGDAAFSDYTVIAGLTVILSRFHKPVQIRATAASRGPVLPAFPV
jgi:hypothetical protein